MDAPLYLEVSDAPSGGRAYWATTSDDTRIRFAYWPGSSGETVLLFPGRGEYIEKYGRVIQRLSERGLGCIILDWRNQGLSDRAAKTGHVDSYLEYQTDLNAVLSAAPLQHLSEPVHLLAHSMGGLIALRSLKERLKVKSAVFSAPMWGMGLNPVLRNLLKYMAAPTSVMGVSKLKLPGANSGPYVLRADPKTNTLMSDVPTFNWFKAQIEAHPHLGLGGPSWGWLHSSHKEIRELANFPVLNLPTVTFLGSNEGVVDPKVVYKRMSAPNSGKLVVVDGARHEVLMETPKILQQVWTELDQLWGISGV